MPDDLLIRDARPDEAAFAAEMTRKMVVEIERYGGRPAARSEPAWAKIAEQIAADLQQETAKYLVAVNVSGQRIGYAAARIVTSEGAFEPKRTVHMSVVYVVPASRQTGVARRLVAKVLEWGQATGAEYCSLNVLANNPARSLYQSLGFLDTDIQMTRRFEVVAKP
jgi:ribosomal protein S18 acetylase RimI-like enzyme